jgi:hypothetical protein
MTLDTRARREAQEALATVQGVSAMQQLVELRQQDRNRQRAKAISMTAAALVVVCGGWFLATQTAAPNTMPPASSESTHVQPTAPSGGLCSSVTCLGKDRYTVPLRVPVTLTLPPTFVDEFDFLTNGMVLSTYRSDGDQPAGVVVLERALPAKYDASWTQSPQGGETAESLARWLSRRPFLEDTTLTQTTLGGLAAWRVTGSLRPDATLPAVGKALGQVAPTFITMDGIRGVTGSSAYSPDLAGEYWLVDVHGAGVVVVWSLAQSVDDLTPNQVLIDSLSFG